MNYSKGLWDQLKGLHIEKFVKALLKDGFKTVKSRGATTTYLHSDGRIITIHYHPKKTCGPKLMKKLLDQTGWSEDDLKRLRLIKRIK